jgi:hypothetical protein
MKSQKNDQDEIKEIENNLTKHKTEKEKRLYLYRLYADKLQQGILSGDPNDGQNNPIFKWIQVELRYMRLIRQMENTQSINKNH